VDHLDERIEVVAENGKAGHGAEFIGGGRRLGAIIANVQKEGCYQKDVDRIDPGIDGALVDSDRQLVSLVDEKEKAEDQKGLKGPGREGVAEKGDGEEQGGY